ncbi:MAG: hypothetical protein C5B49_13715 [Bdellovibrio sp.]|nr:MAG: hypothetical protein C5B49_13715 [Bdellovibrio sp.]
MSTILTVLQSAEIPQLLDYENRKLAEHLTDEVEQAITSWNSRWRPESLEYYIPLGWSFVARDKDVRNSSSSSSSSGGGGDGETGPIVGYFIAQPLLFFDGQSQSLWIEHLQFSSLMVRDELCDLAYRLAREKHFQRVYYPKFSTVMNSIKQIGAHDWSPSVAVVKSTRG